MTDAPQEASRSDLAQRLVTALGQCDRVLVERKNAVGEYDVEMFQADSARAAADLVPRWSDDMDAAPRDGTFVVVYSPDAAAPEWGDPGIRVTQWEIVGWRGLPWAYAVTHWMPLPAPPKEGE